MATSKIKPFTLEKTGDLLNYRNTSVIEDSGSIASVVKHGKICILNLSLYLIGQVNDGTSLFSGVPDDFAPANGGPYVIGVLDGSSNLSLCRVNKTSSGFMSQTPIPPGRYIQGVIVYKSKI